MEVLWFPSEVETRAQKEMTWPRSRWCLESEWDLNLGSLGTSEETVHLFNYGHHKPVCVLSTQPCLTLCNPMDCSPPAYVELKRDPYLMTLYCHLSDNCPYVYMHESTVS